MAADIPDAAALFADAIADLPPGDPSLDWIWDAWLRLHKGDRPHMTIGIGVPMGGTMIKPQPGRLPWTVLRIWADHHAYSDADFDLFDTCVQAMDDEYLRWWAAEQQKAAS